MDGDMGPERKRSRLEGGAAGNPEQRPRGKGDSRPSTARASDLVPGRMTERQMLKEAFRQSLEFAPPEALQQLSDEETEEEEDQQRSPRSPRKHAKLGNDGASRARAAKGELRVNPGKRKASGNGKSGGGEAGESSKGNRVKKKVPATHEARSPQKRKTSVQIKEADTEPSFLSSSGRDVPIQMDPDVSALDSPSEEEIPEASGGSQVTDSTMLDMREGVGRIPVFTATAASASEEETMESRLQARRTAESGNSPVQSSSQGESLEASPESTQEICMKRDAASSDPEDGASEDDTFVRGQRKKRRQVVADYKDVEQDCKQTAEIEVENERRCSEVAVPNITTPQKVDIAPGRAQMPTPHVAADTPASPRADRLRKGSKLGSKASMQEMKRGSTRELKEEDMFGGRSRPKPGKGEGDGVNLDTVSFGAGDSSQQARTDAELEDRPRPLSPRGGCTPRTPYQSPFTQRDVTLCPSTSLGTTPKPAHPKHTTSEEGPQLRFPRLPKQAREEPSGPIGWCPRRSGRVAALESSERPTPAYQDEPPSPSFSQNRLSDCKPAFSLGTDTDRQGPRTRPSFDVLSAAMSRGERATSGIRAPRSKPAAPRRSSWGASIAPAYSKKPFSGVVPPLSPQLAPQPASYSNAFRGQHQLFAALNWVGKFSPSRARLREEELFEDPFLSPRCPWPAVPLPPLNGARVEPGEAVAKADEEPPVGTFSVRSASLGKAPSDSCAAEACPSQPVLEEVPVVSPAQDDSGPKDPGAQGTGGTVLAPRTPKLEEEGWPQDSSALQRSRATAVEDADAVPANTARPPSVTGLEQEACKNPESHAEVACTSSRVSSVAEEAAGPAEECSAGRAAGSDSRADVAEGVASLGRHADDKEDSVSLLGTSLGPAADCRALERLDACSSSLEHCDLDDKGPQCMNIAEDERKLPDTFVNFPERCWEVERDQDDQGSPDSIEAPDLPGNPLVSRDPSSAPPGLCGPAASDEDIVEPSCIKTEPVDAEPAVQALVPVGPQPGLPETEASAAQRDYVVVGERPSVSGGSALSDAVEDQELFGTPTGVKGAALKMEPAPLKIEPAAIEIEGAATKREPAACERDSTALETHSAVAECVTALLESIPASLEFEAATSTKRAASATEPAPMEIEPASVKTEPSCLAAGVCIGKANCRPDCLECRRGSRLGSVAQRWAKDAGPAVLRSSRLRRLGLVSRDPSSAWEFGSVPSRMFRLLGPGRCVERSCQGVLGSGVLSDEEEGAEPEHDGEEDVGGFLWQPISLLGPNADLQQGDYAALQVADQENVPKGRTTRSMPAPCLLRPMAPEMFDEDEEYSKLEEMFKLDGVARGMAPWICQE